MRPISAEQSSIEEIGVDPQGAVVIDADLDVLITASSEYGAPPPVPVYPLDSAWISVPLDGFLAVKDCFGPR